MSNEQSIRDEVADDSASCDCGHPRVEHDYGVGECYLSGCKCRKWEAATDDHEALVEVMTAATFVDGERRLVGWGPIADAILAAGFRRTVQGEPSDAVVTRALEAYWGPQSTGFWFADQINSMRVALRAAAATDRENGSER